jgi:small-conductance mechanosensitive channel
MKMRNLLTVAFAVALVAALVAWWRTAPESTSARRATTAAVVDSAAIDTARRLASYATTAGEQALAARAIEAADHVLDLNFAQALRDATDHPPPETPEIRAAHARLEDAAQLLVTDNLKISALREAVAVTPEDRRGAVEGELALAEAEYEIHQYQFAAANRALAAAGGDLRARIEALVAEHRAAGAKPDALPAAIAWPVGLVRLSQRWLEIRRKSAALAGARTQAVAAGDALANQQKSLAAKVSDATAFAGTTSAERLAHARQLASDRGTLATLDERVSAHRDLVQVYDEWRGVVERQFQIVSHRILSGVALIAGVILVLLLAGRLLGHALARLKLDRRQTESLRTVAMVALQVLGMLLIAFVLVGPPTQLATIIGLVTAGLTVALKDFVVAFAGWFVLMGRNGIRIGDWVEIRGVAGEVVELGMFHTVLLETGNWTDSDHPTGRRVTFTNGYAISGHYFNFSTTGQWLWDSLQVVVPNGADLYSFVGAISEKAKAMTAEGAAEAETEWRRAARTRKLTGLSAEPAINVRPVVGGTEISLRYISRADQRQRLRSELYGAAVQLLGGKAPA